MYRKLIAIFTVATIALVLFSQYNSASATGESVGVWMTSADQSKLLAQQSSVNFGANSGSNPLTITVNPGTKYQTMDGWGASITDSSGWLMWNKLSSGTRNTLMNDLFNKSTGIGLSLLRQPMGATDLSASGNYSYDDNGPDANLNNFSTGHDNAYIIPLLQQALGINSTIKIIATPWSPPGWMKTTGSMIGGNLLSAQYSNSLAQYFVKFIQSYQSQGIPIYGLTIQNEPLYQPTGYPGMGVAAADAGGFIGANLGPALASAGLNTKIIVYDHNWDQIGYPTTVYQNSSAYNYVAGTGWHCYGGDISTELTFHNNYPNKDTWMTECSDGTWVAGDTFSGRLISRAETLMVMNARNWGKGDTMWNLALDTNHGPTNGGCTTCYGVVTINQGTGTYSREADYYVMGQASKFVDSGAYRIDSNTFGSGSVEDVAFQNPDGSLVVYAVNNAGNSQTIKIVWNGQAISYTIPGSTVATFKWMPGSGGSTESPFTGTAAPIPGKIEAENYDNGGEGVAYHDSDTVNSGGQYRAGDGVDIEATTDTGGGYDVGWTATGEWTKYMTNVTSAGTYNIDFRVASTNATSTFHLEVDGNNVTGTLTVPNTGGWQTWTTVTKTGVSLSAGAHTLRWYIDNGGMNINWINFSQTSSGGPTATPTFVPPTITPTPVSGGGINSSAWYEVVNQGNGKCVDDANGGTANGNVIQQWACFAGSNNQEWQFQPTSGGYYKIVSKNATGSVWDIAGPSTANGALLHLWAYGGGANQQWLPVALDSTHYKFVNQYSGTCLDVPAASTTDGVQLEQYTCNGTGAQSWSLSPQ